MRTNRFVVITSDTLVYAKGLILKGFVLLCSALGGDIVIYDGQDATSGRKVGTFKGLANASTPIDFGEGLRLERGLFVDVGSSVTEVLLYFDPWEIESETEE